jgi:hypothetical protein
LVQWSAPNLFPLLIRYSCRERNNGGLMPNAVVASEAVRSTEYSLCKELDVSPFYNPSGTDREGSNPIELGVGAGCEGGIVSDSEMQCSRRLWAIGDSCTFSNLPRITDHLVQLKHEQVTYSSLSSASPTPIASLPHAK